MFVPRERSAPPGKQRADQPSDKGGEDHKKSLDDPGYVGSGLRDREERIAQDDAIHPRNGDDADDPVRQALDE
jgi:hypothetical protein